MKSRFWIRTAILLGVLALTILGIRHFFFAPVPAPAVITATVIRGDIEESVLASGTVDAARLVSVGAQVSGRLEHMAVALGDKVTRGQLIAEIDSTTQQNEVRNNVAALEVARASKRSREAALDNAILSYERARELASQDAGSRADLETADANLKMARAENSAADAQLEQARITAETARVKLGYARITSPIDGVVVAIVTEEGQTVTSSQTIPTIVKVAQLDTMIINSQISEGDITRVKAGMPAYFTIFSEPDRRYEASLRSVAPAPSSLSSDTRPAAGATAAAIYYNGRFDVPNRDGRLLISMTAQVTIVVAQARAALLIPAGALSGRPDARGFHTVRVQQGEGKQTQLLPRKIRIGLNNRVQVQVLEGLRAGEKVVIGISVPSGQNGTGGGRRGPQF